EDDQCRGEEQPGGDLPAAARRPAARVQRRAQDRRRRPPWRRRGGAAVRPGDRTRGRSGHGRLHQADTPCLVSSAVNLVFSLSSSALVFEPQLATIPLIVLDASCRNGVNAGRCGKYWPFLA